jgi:hypothetical protein
VLSLLDETQMRVLISFKPKTYRETRLHVAVLLVLDTGLRIAGIRSRLGRQLVRSRLMRCRPSPLARGAPTLPPTGPRASAARTSRQLRGAPCIFAGRALCEMTD